MLTVVVIICLVLFLVLAGADLLVSNINSDELSNMGIKKKS
jgi:Ca2+/Na+ antiporter